MYCHVAGVSKRCDADLRRDRVKLCTRSHLRCIHNQLLRNEEKAVRAKEMANELAPLTRLGDTLKEALDSFNIANITTIDRLHDVMVELYALPPDQLEHVARHSCISTWTIDDMVDTLPNLIENKWDEYADRDIDSIMWLNCQLRNLRDRIDELYSRKPV